MKIKLVIIDGYTDYDGDWRSQVIEGISDWEEVTEEDYQYIKSNLWRLNIKNGTPVLIRQDKVSIFDRIKDIKKTIKEREEAENKKREEARQKAEERAAVRAAKKLERDRKALERLVAENPDLVKGLVAINS